MSNNGLYTNEDAVHILNDSDFVVDANGEATLKSDAFMGAGIIKAYAVWCPHCIDKVNEIKCLGAILQDNQEQYGVSLYVFEASGAQNMGNAKSNGESLISGFPTFLFVGQDGSVSKLKVTKNGSTDDVHSVEESIMGLCSEQKKMCGFKYSETNNMCTAIKERKDKQRKEKQNGQKRQNGQTGGKWW